MCEGWLSLSTRRTIEGVVAYRDWKGYDTFLRHVMGLNLFLANHTDSEIDPRVVFLAALSKKKHLSLLIGTQAHDDQNLIEVFTSHWPHIRVNFDVWQMFIAGNTFLLLNVTPTFILSLQAELQEILVYDALACFITENEDHSLEALSSKAFEEDGSVHEASDAWRQRLVSQFYAVVMSTDDGYSFEVYGRDTVNLEVVNEAMQEAAEAVKQDAWYQQNRNRLVWLEDDADNCLKLVN